MSIYKIYLFPIILLAIFIVGCIAETSTLSLGNFASIEDGYLGKYKFKLNSSFQTSLRECYCSVTKHNSTRYKVVAKCYDNKSNTESFEEIIPLTKIEGKDFISIPIPQLYNKFIFAQVRKTSNDNLKLSILSTNAGCNKQCRQYIEDRLYSGIPIVHNLYLERQ